jgi:hypothetical protein
MVGGSAQTEPAMNNQQHYDDQASKFAEGTGLHLAWPVRCKECAQWVGEGFTSELGKSNTNRISKLQSRNPKINNKCVSPGADWFCADGEPK